MIFWVLAADAEAETKMLNSEKSRFIWQIAANGVPTFYVYDCKHLFETFGVAPRSQMAELSGLLTTASEISTLHTVSGAAIPRRCDEMMMVADLIVPHSGILRHATIALLTRR
jgi:hypothetical protein